MHEIIMSIFFITGTSGSGKSTVMEHLKKLLPESHFVVHDFDEVGVPSDADQAWRIATTQYWIKRAQQYAAQNKTTVICGVTVPSEVLNSPIRPALPIHFGFIKIDDQTIEQRLKQREWSDSLIEDNLNWSHYLEQEIAKQKSHFILNASHMTPDQVAASFIEWIKSKRINR